MRTDVLEMLRSTPPRSRYGAVLLPIGRTRSSERLTRAVAALANQWRARLVGVSVAPVAGAEPTTAAEQEAVQLLLEASGQRFDSLTREVLAGRRWTRSEGPLFTTLRAHAWGVDLIVLGDDVLQARSGRAELRRLLALTSCPVLVWPERLPPQLLGEAAVLCDGSPASLRAIRSALPILSRCLTVTLVGDGPQVGEVWRGLKDRGCVDVRTRRLEAPLSQVVARQLLSLGADLVVVGGWPEVLGGWPQRSVTDHLLTDAETPLFIGG